MSKQVKVAYSDAPADVATKLLAAAERLDLDPGVVVTTSDNVFVVPADVAKEAGVKPVKDDAAPEPEQPADESGLPEDIAALKGKALDAALDEAGLAKDGKVAEKRQRLADHYAGSGE